MHWVGRWAIARIQFRDNVLPATDAPRTDFQEVVEEVRGVLEEVRGIPVRCDCANDAGVCQDRCMGPVCRAMGYCIVRTHATAGRDESCSTRSTPGQLVSETRSTPNLPGTWVQRVSGWNIF